MIFEDLTTEILTERLCRWIDHSNESNAVNLQEEVIIRGTVDITCLQLITCALTTIVREDISNLTLELEWDKNYDLETNLYTETTLQLTRSKNIDHTLTQVATAISNLANCICTLPFLNELDISLKNFDRQCVKNVLNMFECRQRNEPNEETTEASKGGKDSKESKDGAGGIESKIEYIDAFDENVFPCLLELTLSSDLFVFNEEKEDDINDEFENNDNIQRMKIDDGDGLLYGSSMTSTGGGPHDIGGISGIDNDEIALQKWMLEQIAANRAQGQAHGQDHHNGHDHHDHHHDHDHGHHSHRDELNSGGTMASEATVGKEQGNDENKKNGNEQNENKENEMKDNSHETDIKDEKKDDISHSNIESKKAKSTFEQISDIIKGTNVNELKKDEILLNASQSSVYYPLMYFLEKHPLLQKVDLNVNKGGKNGITIVTRILWCLSRRQCLESLSINCPKLHGHYVGNPLCCIVLNHSFFRFNISFSTLDDNTVSKILCCFGKNRNLFLNDFCINSSLNAIDAASVSLHFLNQFLKSHSFLEKLSISYFDGIDASSLGLWTQFLQQLYINGRSLSSLTIGNVFMHDNFIIHQLCEKIICKCTQLNQLCVKLSPASYEGFGGVLENCKKCVFYLFKNQEMLMEQVSKTQVYLEMYYQCPIVVSRMITQYAFNIGITHGPSDELNEKKEKDENDGKPDPNATSIELVLDGVMGSDIEAILTQTERLKQIKAKEWANINRDVMLSIRDKQLHH